MPSPVLELVCRAFGESRPGDCPDDQLLRRFADEGDAAAFGALVRRHGPMVLDVCRGLLPGEEDAEDAFQATFLVLAKKAGSVRKPGSLASWLHGVALRVARRARTAFARRRKHEPRAARPASDGWAADELSWAEIRAVVHEELAALPERLRGPLIRCYLEGATQDETAAELGLPKGTLRHRLERGRELLRARLVRRGLGPVAVLLASAWPVTSVSAALAETAVRATTVAGQATAGLASARVAALAGEVLRATSLTKFRTATFVALAAAFCAGVCAFALNASADAPAGDRPASARAENPAPQPAPPQPKLIWQEGPAAIPKQNGRIDALAFSPDGKMLAVAVTKTLLNGEVKGEVTVYDRTDGKELTVLSGFAPVAFSPDGKMLAAREGDSTVRVWEVGKLAPQVALKGLSDTVLCLAFSPDNKFLAAGSGNPSKSGTPGMVRLWDLENGGERATHTHPGPVPAVSFADEGKTLLSTSMGQKWEAVVKSWDVARGRELAEVKGPGRPFGAVAFSPDGKTVATGIDPVGYRVDMDVKVWDRATGKELIKPLHHPELVRALAFAPDGKTLATGIRASAGARTGGEAHLWDVSTGKEIAVLRGHKENVQCLTFDRSGKTLATGDEGGAVKLWVLAEPVDESDELWVKSEDGALALRVSTFVKTAEPGEPIELVARLRNLSDKPVHVLRPFRPGPLVWWAINVTGPRGPLSFVEAPPKYQVPPEDFVRLKPGETVRESVTIDPRGYRGFAAPGRYTLNFTYGYKGLWDEAAEKAGLTRVWRGSIAGKGVPVEIRDAEGGTWVKSADGVLALRLTARVTEVKPGDPIEVVAALRNLSDKPIHVLRPGGDNYRARSSGIDLRGPKGAIRYTGDTPSYTLGATSFVTLEPGEAVSNHLSITVDDRQGSDRPGEYRVAFSYEADDGHRTTATKQLKLKDLWTGQIKSEPVAVKKAEPKPVADEKARLYAAFRADVEPVVRKLPKVEADRWLAELRDEKKWEVRRQPFADALKRVEDTLRPEERKTAILRGTLPDLKRDGDCWEVHFFDGRGDSLTGYLDVRTGKLVFLWLIPEG